MITFPQQHYSYYYIYRWTDSQIILVLQNSSSDTLQNQLPCPWLSMKNSNKQVPRGILVPQLYSFACEYKKVPRIAMAAPRALMG